MYSAALTLMNFLGYLFTSFWTHRLYNASMIKHLYKVKHTSAGRDKKAVPLATANEHDDEEPLKKQSSSSKSKKNKKKR